MEKLVCACIGIFLGLVLLPLPGFAADPVYQITKEPEGQGVWLSASGEINGAKWRFEVGDFNKDNDKVFEMLKSYSTSKPGQKFVFFSYGYPPLEKLYKQGRKKHIPRITGQLDKLAQQVIEAARSDEAEKLSGLMGDIEKVFATIP